jgi:hypothetical protein
MLDADNSFKVLSGYAQFVVISLLAGFFLLIVYRLFTGAINTKGLLQDKSGGGPSPARVQLCLLSLSGAFYYLMSVIEIVQNAKMSDPVLPAPPKELLALVLGSNTVYVTAKATAAARQVSRVISVFR